MKTLLQSLTALQKETLLAWCEDLPYHEVKKRALAELHLSISESSFCRLYTTHQIADTADRAKEYLTSADSAHHDLIQTAAAQLQLRLLELSARPHPDAATLRALYQIITRLQSLALAQRRVRLAETREARLAAKDAPAPTRTPVQDEAEMQQCLRHILGKEYIED